uniref:Uncharacterized protein n=1 Tax=Ciona savignyi TaxID=51511 RepID=H2YAU6_CIOSA
CSGSGKITCNYCRGIGHTASHDVLFEHLDHNNHQPRRISRNETCHHCGGSGTEVCCTCHGCGRCSCCHCNGCGEVVKYLAVHVKRDTLCDQRVTNTHNLPSSLFKRCGGLIVFQDTNEALTPLTKDICLNKDMQIVSRELLNSHRPPNMAHSNRQQRIKHQTHIVRLVPIHKVTYSYRGKGGYVYWVVGMEKDVQVYCPDYPNTFCGCAIM